MSSIGAANFPAVSIASSVAGGQQARPGQDSAKAAAASQDFRSNLQAKESRAVEDVGETTLETDRDADGFYLPDQPEGEQEQNSSQEQEKQLQTRSHRSVDPDHMIGTHLDLDA